MTSVSKRNIKLPEFGDLSEKINFQAKEGKIWLDEQRSILMTLPALANLRREVAETIGKERTKGFFMRLGYLNGTNDAELARKLRPDAEMLERFLVGPQMHMLRGMVKVEPQVIEIDIEKERFYMEHIWIDSYEADMSLHDWGVQKEPVCWSLIGYACGYCTGLLGFEVLFKEQECRGAGDSRCYVVGKTATEWDDYKEYRNYFVSDPIIEELHELQYEISTLRSNIDESDTLRDAVGQSKNFQRVCMEANRVSRSKVTVMITGETGVGKEVIAKGIHANSDRADNAFVAMNCAVLPPDLIEAELFGVEKGAFTGASQSREGRFERADKGTLFLDEVAELTPRAQASLLRVLQESELERVGGSEVRKVDVRVIAATNEDLAESVKAGRFRADLYYRLNVFPVHIPPLRQRTDDIPLLVDYFLDKYQVLYKKKLLGLSDRAMDKVMSYNWPGNIRELENLIERGVILTENRYHIEARALFPEFDETAAQGSSVSLSGDIIDKTLSEPSDDAAASGWLDQIFSDNISLETVERQLLQQAMQRCDNNVAKAARLLGMTRPAFAYRLSKLS